MKPTKVIDLFQKARKSDDLAVIEGVQALKHAIRFGADIQTIITCDINLLSSLIDELAKDVKDKVIDKTEEVDEGFFAKLSPHPPRTKTIALAKRKTYSIDELNPSKPLVILENPKDLENIGAVIRVCAAADTAGVYITGKSKIWHPAVLRGSAGLHFALPVLNVTEKDVFALNRPIVSLDPDGADLQITKLPRNSILLFGTERFGVSKKSLQNSDLIVRLPMRKGVSSLNLATSVAATLYSLK